MKKETKTWRPNENVKAKWKKERLTQIKKAKKGKAGWKKGKASQG